MPVWIANLSHYVPPRVVTNDDLIRAEGLKMKASWVERFIGIRERRFAEPDVTASDLAANAIAALGVEDFRGSLFVSTVSPDYLTPSTAALVKRKARLASRHPAIDVNAACAGHLFALDLARARLESTNETEALVVATEVRSRFLNRQDRRTVFLFGDGAAAFHLRKEDASPGSVEWVHSASMPSDAMEIFVPAGGSAMPLSSKVLEEGHQYIVMNDGPKIVELTTKLLVETIQEVLAEKGRTTSDYDVFVFHQGNANISAKICAALGIPEEKTSANFARFGNTSSASCGISLSELHAEGRLKRGDRVLLVAMGAGYHMSVASVVWAL